MKFKNKIIWITGASSGIGEALSKAFASSGALLILSGRNIEALKVVQEFCLQKNVDVELLPFDVTDIDQLDQVVTKAISFYGSIDYLVNNAGISQRSLVMESPLEIDRKIMEVDYFSKVALTKALLPYMIKQKHGHIIVISSIAGKFGFPYRSAYSAAKHALLGFFESLRLELVDVPIYVTNVCPGRIRTNISINAVNAKGEKHGEMDYGQDQGMSADVCAGKILEAVANKKKEVYIGGKEILMVYFKRYIPSLFYFLASRVNPK
jgi:dehydrogenase/reductase SDR family member 7B